LPVKDDLVSKPSGEKIVTLRILPPILRNICKLIVPIKNNRTDSMDIIAVAFDKADGVKRFYLKARMFYYSVIIFDSNCPNAWPFSCFLE
jgi:hypothetical protein